MVHHAEGAKSTSKAKVEHPASDNAGLWLESPAMSVQISQGRAEPSCFRSLCTSCDQSEDLCADILATATSFLIWPRIYLDPCADAYDLRPVLGLIVGHMFL